MWRKQSEGKPSSSASGSFDLPSYAPPASSAPTPVSSQSSSSSHPSSPAVSPDTSLLTRGIRIKGDLTGKGELAIDGEITGSIRLGDSRVSVGPNGRVKADIEARDISVRGNVEGNLRGRDRVLLGTTSKVNGNINAVRVVIEDGAQFRGRVEMGSGLDAERETPKKTSASVHASAPATSAPKPALPAVPATPASSSTPASAPDKESIILPAPVGAPEGSR